MPRLPRDDFLNGAREILPLAVGVAVYGLAFGLLAAQAGMVELQAGIMGATVFAGASQIVAIERLVAGAGATAALIAALALNLRLLLITASIREVFAHRPLWQIILGAHTATDENWALFFAARNKGQNVGYWYLIGSGAVLAGVWIISTVSGVTFAAFIPEPRALGMDFAFTAAFIAIARSLWKGKQDLVPWVSAAAVVSLLSGFDIVSPSWSMVAGGLAGALIAGVSYRE